MHTHTHTGAALKQGFASKQQPDLNQRKHTLISKHSHQAVVSLPVQFFYYCVRFCVCVCVLQETPWPYTLLCSQLVNLVVKNLELRHPNNKKKDLFKTRICSFGRHLTASLYGFALEICGSRDSVVLFDVGFCCFGSSVCPPRCSLFVLFSAKEHTFHFLSLFLYICINLKKKKSLKTQKE